jgi:hypothetical protein
VRREVVVKEVPLVPAGQRVAVNVVPVVLAAAAVVNAAQVELVLPEVDAVLVDLAAVAEAAAREDQAEAVVVPVDLAAVDNAVPVVLEPVVNAVPADLVAALNAVPVVQGWAARVLRALLAREDIVLRVAQGRAVLVLGVAPAVHVPAAMGLAALVRVAARDLAVHVPLVVPEPVAHVQRVPLGLQARVDNVALAAVREAVLASVVPEEALVDPAVDRAAVADTVAVVPEAVVRAVRSRMRAMPRRIASNWKEPFTPSFPARCSGWNWITVTSSSPTFPARCASGSSSW